MVKAKFSMEFDGRLLPGFNGLVEGIESAQPKSFTAMADVCLPLLISAVPANTGMTGSIVTKSTSVLHVFRSSAKTKILAAIVKRVAVNVIHHLSRLRIHDYSVNQRASVFQANIKAICRLTPLAHPWESAKKLIIFWADLSEATVNQFKVHARIIPNQCWERV